MNTGIAGNSQRSIDSFLSMQSYAVVGVSRSGSKFGNDIYRTLKERGCAVYPVNTRARTIEGDRCYARVQDVPGRVDGVVIVVPPKQTESVVKDMAEAGIRKVWMQQGSESRKAIEFCEQYGIDAIYGRCIFMFLEPVESVHRVHRWLSKVLGRMPSRN